MCEIYFDCLAMTNLGLLPSDLLTSANLTDLTVILLPFDSVNGSKKPPWFKSLAVCDYPDGLPSRPSLNM